MGAALTCRECQEHITDSAVWVPHDSRTHVCVKCYDRSKHRDFSLKSTQFILQVENEQRLADEKEIHRLLPLEVSDAKAARVKLLCNH